jgi:hypothetical protein
MDDMDTKPAEKARKTHGWNEATRIRNAWVGGSNPSCGTISLFSLVIARHRVQPDGACQASRPPAESICFRSKILFPQTGLHIHARISNIAQIANNVLVDAWWKEASL